MYVVAHCALSAVHLEVLLRDFYRSVEVLFLFNNTFYFIVGLINLEFTRISTTCTNKMFPMLYNIIMS